MDYDNLRTSELDRELDAEIQTKQLTYLMMTDDDPTFDPNQASTSRAFSNQGRLSPVFDSDSDSEYYDIPRQSKRPKQQPRSMLVPLPTPRQGAIFSDESDDVMDLTSRLTQLATLSPRVPMVELTAPEGYSVLGMRRVKTKYGASTVATLRCTDGAKVSTLLPARFSSELSDADI
ncbi:hypothetical protein J6590_088392 [Homalodisca vitripennis]|nr:hypothetical protein J6590_088392 [Homalodisca vitripennis]